MSTFVNTFEQFLEISSFAQLCYSRWPETCEQLHKQDALNHATPERLIQHLNAHAPDDCAHALRQLRQLACLRIAWRDVSGQASFQQSCAELSALADHCQQLALQQALNTIQTKFGPLESVDPSQAPPSFCVLAMGKLGSQELNFSSDIDVLFVYSGAGQTTGRRKRGSSEYFTKVAQEWIGLLDRVNEYGQCYRVDTRLRPFGSAGALCWSTAALEHYYQREGRDWERFAWLRARPVAGDLALGQGLIEQLRPFVFRRYLDYGLFEGVRRIRNEIEQESRRKGRQQHLKLGPGGIREVEFLVQSHLILRGGQVPALRQGNTLKSLAACQHEGLIPAAEAQQLSQAYVALRSAENRLQMLDDQQRHELPQDAASQNRLAALMSQSWSEFIAQLAQHQQHVQQQFHSLFQEPETAAESIQLNFDDDEPQHNIDQLERLGFDGARAWHLLQAQQRKLCGFDLSHEAWQRINSFRPRLLAAISEQQASTQLLDQCLDLLTTVARRSAYLALLLENPLALQRMVDLFQRSHLVAQWVQQQPSLLDDLIHPQGELPQQAQIQHQLKRRQRSQDDDEKRHEALVRTQHSVRLNIAITALSDDQAGQAVAVTQVQQALSLLAESLVNHILLHLLPQSDSQQCGFCVIAYGTLGAAEMHYESDLDLVFLYEPKRIDEKQATRLARRIIHWLSTTGRAGRLYEIDTRLRPNGRSGLLVSSVQAFRQYQSEQAWTWEQQALARARPIAGDEAIQQHFMELRQDLLQQQRAIPALQSDFSTMRNKLRQAHGGRFQPDTLESGPPTLSQSRLKHGPGGLLDLQFIVQYWQLALSHDFPQLSHTQHSADLLLQLQQIQNTPHIRVPPVAQLDFQALGRAWHRLSQCQHHFSLTGTQEPIKTTPDIANFANMSAAINDAMSYTQHCYQVSFTPPADEP
jgi:glutamate-ammonia-ligase adenylyltransferase